MAISGRTKRQTGRHALVDGIPFVLPMGSEPSPTLLAVFSIDPAEAAKLLPGNEIHPFRLWKKGMLIVAVIDYRDTALGKYIEFNIGIACTHGPRPAPRLLPGIFRKHYGTGQFVLDLPVSTEISLKAGKGIFCMPKVQANLNFTTDEDTVRSQYDLEGRLAMKIEVKRPKRAWLPVNMGTVNYSTFRGLLKKTYVFSKGTLGCFLFKKDSARLTIGDHPRVESLKKLGISTDPIFCGYFPNAHGYLDDHSESWFITYEQPPQKAPEGFESVINLGMSHDWLPPPQDRN